MPTTQPRRGFLREPRSPAEAAATFAAAFAVFQPAMQWLLHAMLRAPLPATGAGGWAGYVAAVAGLGGAVGVAWQVARTRPHSRLARWAGTVAQYVAMAAFLSGRYFAELRVVGWYGLVLFTAAVTAVIFGWVDRMLRPAFGPPAA